MQIWFGNR